MTTTLKKQRFSISLKSFEVCCDAYFSPFKYIDNHVIDKHEICLIREFQMPAQRI